MKATAHIFSNLPLVVIVGPTASGKTSLGIELAVEFGGEIICADSRTIYKGMDIGTAKPTAAEQLGIPHWGLDLVAPGEYYSAADFKEYADEKIAEIRARGHVPFLVGGTGLYIDGVIFDYTFGSKADTAVRAKLEKYSLEELQNYCKNNNIVLPENDKNKRYVVRAIEQSSSHQRSKGELDINTIIVGIATEKDELRRRIVARAEHLFENGMVDEAIRLGEKYGWESEAMTANIYRLTKNYLDGELSKSELQAAFVTSDWRLAKRQLTWLKRNSFIHWASLTEAKIYLQEQLAKITG